MSVLADLVAEAHRRAGEIPKSGLRPRAGRSSFRDAIAGRERLSVIAEFKRSSPSMGAIALDAGVLTQLRRYQRAGAAAISVLTESSRFGGRAEDLEIGASGVAVPLLMKDFIVAPAQIELAAHLGASAVLLIMRCLDDAQLDELLAACRTLALDALIECHDRAEVERALAVPDAVIGINNRDLDKLDIDRGRAAALLPLVPADRIAVAESGYVEPEQTRAVRGAADAVLIGTELMRCEDPERFIRAVGTPSGAGIEP